MLWITSKGENSFNERVILVKNRQVIHKQDEISTN